MKRAKQRNRRSLPAWHSYAFVREHIADRIVAAFYIDGERRPPPAGGEHRRAFDFLLGSVRPPA